MSNLKTHSPLKESFAFIRINRNNRKFRHAIFYEKEGILHLRQLRCLFPVQERTAFSCISKLYFRLVRSVLVSGTKWDKGSLLLGGEGCVFGGVRLG